MRGYIVVWYTRAPILADHEFEPGEFYSTPHFDDALDTYEAMYWPDGHVAELWMFDHMGWYRLRFESNHQDTKQYLG